MDERSAAQLSATEAAQRIREGVLTSEELVGACLERIRQVEPTVVVEVAFDVIVRSKRHQSGYSLRFPRIANLRPDKPLDEIDTVDTVRALYEGLQHGAEQLVTAGARK